MSKKQLKIHPSERLDIDDLTYGTSTYVDDNLELLNKSLISSKRAQSLGGSFRIQIGDQSSFPGLITVHNGRFIAKNGELVSNEELVTASDSVTLTGSNQTFYVELEAASSESDVDDRAFWDATFDNGAGNLAGKEYTDSVTTRISTIWRIVTPVSTTGFAITSDVSSNKIPLAIIKTDGSGSITTSVNTGMATGTASTVLEQAVAATDVVLRLADTTVFGDNGSTISIGVGDGFTETRTVSSNDRVNGIITITSGLSSPHAAGAIVRDNGTNQFIKERTAATTENVGASSTHPDKLKRLFSGDESRGKALLSSKETVGGRDDTQLKTLKDEIDALSALIREMKVGDPLAVFPSSYSATRYYDYAGSIQGAKTATYTIGNGTTSIGDFNGTTHAPFAAAVAAAVASGYTDVVLYVKRGTYTFGATVAANVNISLIGEATVGSSQVSLVGGISGALFSISGTVNVQSIQVERTVSGTDGAFIVLGSAATFYASRVSTGTLLTPLVTSSNSLDIGVKECDIVSGGTVSAVFNSSQVLTGVVESSSVRITGTSTNFISAGTVKTSCNKVTATMEGNGAFYAHVNLMERASIVDCNISFTSASSTGSVVGAAAGVTSISNCVISNNIIKYDSAANSTVAITIPWNSNSNISNNQITIIYAPAISGSGINGICVKGGGFVSSNLMIENNAISLTSGGLGECIFLTNSRVENVKILNNTLTGGNSGVVFSSLIDSFTFEEGKASITVMGNTYVGGNYDSGSTFTAFHFGLRFLQLPNIIDLNILNNNILGLRGSSAAVGIEVNGQNTYAGTTRSKVLIQGNGLKRIGRPTADETAISIGISAINLLAVTTIRISGNQIDTVFGTQINGINTGGSNTIIAENSIENLRTFSAGAGAVNGISVTSSTRPTVVADNIIDSLNTTAVTSTIYGIQVLTQDASVKGNVVRNVYGTVCAAISATNADKFSCTSNNISFTVTGVLYTTTGTTAVSNLKISENTVASATNGIYVEGLSTSSVQSASISGNIMQLIASVGIHYIAAGSALTITGNTITESITANDNAAIHISKVNRVCISNNSVIGNIINVSTAQYRAAIFADDVDDLTITGNVCYWLQHNASTDVNAANIYIRGGLHASISGNVMEGYSVVGQGKAITVDAFNIVMIGINTIAGSNSVANQVNEINGSTTVVSDSAGDVINLAF